MAGAARIVLFSYLRQDLRTWGSQPVYLIPDFVPVLGYLDDLLLIPLGVFLVLKLIPDEVMAECRQQALEDHERPVNWWSGALIILLWLALAGLGIGWMVRRYLPR